MTLPAAAAANPVAILRRAALLAGLLAVIAGFLGMHILSGSHSLHAQASAHTAGHPAVHTSHDADGTFSQAYDEVPPSCACQGGCAEMPAVHVACTPSPAGASLSAPQPGTTLLEAQPWTTARTDRLSGYAYLPGTPTPRDLSISRT
jgi:hypothetical protein